MLKFHLTLSVTCVWKRTEHTAALFEPFAIAVAAYQQRWIVTGISKRQSTLRDIHHAVERGDKLVQWNIRVKVVVETRGHVLGCKIQRRQRLERCLKVCHQQRGRQALADNISHAQRRMLAIDIESRNIITADCRCWSPLNGDSKTVDRRLCVR